MKNTKTKIPIYTKIFPQDFWDHNFKQGGYGPLAFP